MDFTPRQLEILKLVARDNSDRQIAEQLGWQFITAKVMVRKLALMLGVQTRAQLIDEARKLT
jgi:DNA-binding NarL/FixJ family response regulator